MLQKPKGSLESSGVDRPKRKDLSWKQCWYMLKLLAVSMVILAIAYTVFPNATTFHKLLQIGLLTAIVYYGSQPDLLDGE